MNQLKRSLRAILPQSTLNFYHQAGAWLANVINGYPSRRLRIIGVTGTNGKTTTCHLITAILEASGRRVGMATTVDFKIGGVLTENNSKMTVVNPFALQRLLRQMVQQGCQDAVLETTSIALDQHRLFGIRFDVAVFTNLTHDHLDYHQTMERYRQAKEKLFSHRPALSVINTDDPAAPQFLRHSANRTLTYGITEPADLMAKKIYGRTGGTDFVLLLGQRQATINLSLPGVFNVYNALAAAGVGLGLGCSLEQVVAGLHSVESVPGRMEVVEAGQGFAVIVDYAHTPDALQKVYETIKPTVRGRLISVLGATGNRDKAKRPILGALAGRYADYVIVTNEDPYDEDPAEIIDAVAAGVPRGRPKRGRYKVNREGEIPFKYKESGEEIWWWRILDRKEAIKKALELARPQDVILVTGKGAEKIMVVRGKHLPWSDRAVLEELLVNYQAR